MVITDKAINFVMPTKSQRPCYIHKFDAMFKVQSRLSLSFIRRKIFHDTKCPKMFSLQCKMRIELVWEYRFCCCCCWTHSMRLDSIKDASKFNLTWYFELFSLFFQKYNKTKAKKKKNSLLSSWSFGWADITKFGRLCVCVYICFKCNLKTWIDENKLELSLYSDIHI